MTPPHLRRLEDACRCPQFADVDDAELAEVLREACTERERVLDEVGACPDPVTPENLFHPMERARTAVMDCWSAFSTRAMADAPPERMEWQAELARLGASHGYAVALHEGVLQRLEQLQGRVDAGEIEIDDQDAWVLREMIRNRVKRGARLDEATQRLVSELNVPMTDLESQFMQTALLGRQACAVVVPDRDRLAGLTDGEVARCAAAAADRGVAGYVIELENTTEHPLLERLHDRALREEIFRASTGRGHHPDHDTRPLLVELVTLRRRQAEALGYPSVAALEVDGSNAQDVGAIADLLLRVGRAAHRAAEAEAEELRARFARIEPGATFEAWDWAYVANIVRAERFTLDQELLAPYLELERVLVDGAFGAANMVYGLSFRERHDVPGYTPDTRAFDVLDADGSQLGLILVDPYASETKQGGAWMTPLVDQSTLLGDKAVCTLNLTVPRPAPGEPCLLTWGQVVTLFHEFGHGLHALLSDVRYPSCSGTNVPQDILELPSQVNEMWARDPEVLARFARHHATGEPMPAEWVARLEQMERFGEGRRRLAVVASMLLDQAWHDGRPLPDRPEDVDAFEEQVLRDAGLWHDLVPPRYRSTYFLHTFGGGYTAGYYGYLWAEMFVADCVAWIREQGDDVRATGERLRRGLLAPAGSGDVVEAYVALTGRHPDPQYLLEQVGLA